MANPRLRFVEVVRVVSKGRLVTSLRDPEGLGPGAIVEPPLVAALAYMDGRTSVVDIAARASRRSGLTVLPTEVEALVRALDEACLLVNARSRARLDEVFAEFRASPVRGSRHAGGAYEGHPKRLADFIERECLNPARESPKPKGRPVGLIAPHMDYWRARRGYGDAYGALSAGALVDVKVCVVLGTCHAPMTQPFALTRKAFETPFGRVSTAHDWVETLTTAARFDPFDDEYRHKDEHSIELQIPFLQHLMGGRRFEIVPILCGLGEAQEKQEDPSLDADVERFVSTLAELVANHRAFVVAGADLAHVGPRFGDAKPLDALGQRKLAERDSASLKAALALEAGAFFEHTTEDQAERRVCGVGPIYTLLRSIAAAKPGGHLVAYHQHVDPDEGSIVSHGEVLFTEHA